MNTASSTYFVGEVVFLSFPPFFCGLSADPILLLAALLTLAAVLVNGWTDAPNAIATVVSSGTLPFSAAAILASVCNFLGVWLFSSLFPAVTDTIYHIAHFGDDRTAALFALTAALAAIVLWAVFAWSFGIPTSESHALVAGVTGGAAALHGSLAAIRRDVWGQILLGLLFALLVGYLLGKVASRLLPQKGPYRFGQIFGAALLSFLHGAQDGQKFLGIFLLAVTLAGERQHTSFPAPPLWLIFLLSVTMALGTLMGGRRIIRTLCGEQNTLPPREGFAADLGSGICMLAATLLGLPLSTTHAKTAAIFGAVSANKGHPKAAAPIGLVWLLTFPVCFLLGFLAVKGILAM